MNSLIPVGLLVIALVVLATLQYQSIGQISEIERQKQEGSLVSASNRFAQDFSAEREKLYSALESRRYSGDISSLVARHKEWVQTAPHKNLVETLYIADPDPAVNGLRLREVSIEREAADAVSWPADLINLKTALERETEPQRGWFGLSSFRYRPNPGDAMVLVIAMMGPVTPPQEPRAVPREPGPRRPTGWVIAQLDRAVILDEILPELAERHFPHNDGQGYRVAVVDTDNDAKPVYVSSGPWTAADLMSPDRQVDLFGYSGAAGQPSASPGAPRGRPPGGGPGAGRGPDRGGRGDPGNRGNNRSPDRGRGGGRVPSGTNGPGGPNGAGIGGIGGPGAQGGPGGARSQFEFPGTNQSASPLGHHWRLLVKNEAGSLEAAVEQARRRNLAVSFGVLLVLGAAALTLMVSGNRARALGKLQMEFAAGVSHELRTPLTVIQSAAHNLRSGIVRDPRSVEQYAEIVQKEARRLSGMVEQVMAYAETQSGRRRYDISAIDVTDIVEQALKALAFVDDVAVVVERLLPPDLPPALADPGALSQCVQNLITNAVKYGQRDGEVAIDIEAAYDSAANQIRLSVMDHGPGVPAQDVSHLFDPFHRGSNASTSTPGNGIGLHLVKKTMESQNGTVVYADRPGGGAMFTLILPSADSRT